MSGYLITGTQDPDTLFTPTSEWLARCLESYSKRYQLASPWQVLRVSPQLAQVDWGSLWHTYSQLRLANEPVVVVYPGSLGDGMDAHCTVADLARDWRIPVMLTLPVTASIVSQTVAFTALARQSGACIQGVVLFALESLEPQLSHGIVSRIQTLAQVQVLGILSYPALESGAEGDWAKQAATLHLESLN